MKFVSHIMRARHTKYLKLVLYAASVVLVVRVVLYFRGEQEASNKNLEAVIKQDGRQVLKQMEAIGVQRMSIGSPPHVDIPEVPILGTKPEPARPTRPVDRDSGTCNWNRCNPTKEGMLNVHVVLHSHDDVGWKKTYMQYYNGERPIPQQDRRNYQGGECTRCILSSVIPELLQNPDRRFIFIEMAFFSRWFNEQTEGMKEDVRKLVRERRLELIIGGWCMSDSATTYYDDVIDQHTHGFQWIERELGECAMPRSAWHLDQFGHSREHSSLFAQMGFEGMFVGRIDNMDQERRMQTRNMETVWRTSPDNLGETADLFTSVLYDGYFTPHGMGGFKIPESHKAGYVDRMVNIAKERAKAYKSNHLLIPYGGDFALASSKRDFEYLDSIIKFVNEQQASGGKVNMLYSTPSCYLNSLSKEGIAFETMNTDFFPYGIVPNTYWTGFFTSRPGLKRHTKVASSMLQTCKVISVMAQLRDGYNKVSVLKEAVAVLQHHDAITGTEQQHVSDDYNKILSTGETACQQAISESYQTLQNINTPVPEHKFCPDLNISVCDVTEQNTEFSVSVFNPLGWDTTYWVRLPVKGGQYSVTSPQGLPLKAQMYPLPASTARIPERLQSQAKVELVFKADLPATGYNVYTVKRDGDASLPVAQPADGASISNKYLTLTLDPQTGLTSNLKNLVTGVEVDFQQTFLYYIGSKGGRRIPGDTRGYMGGFFGGHKRASGAYAFVPQEGIPPITMYNKGSRVEVKTFKGEGVQEIHQKFNSWTSQVIRLYDGEPYLEMEWTVGPIPGEDRETREVISRFQTNLKTDSTWYTDSNGREMIRRTKNFHEPFAYNVTCPISGNYYPVTGRMCIKDEQKKIQLTVLTDRSQAGGSLRNGQMELLIHRRTFYDDDLGVEEPLNELGVDGNGVIIRGKHYITLNTVEMAAGDYRPLGLRVHRRPTLSFLPGQPLPDMRTTSSWLKSSLPLNVHLLTLDLTPGNSSTLLLRLENPFERKEWADVATLDLKDYMEGIEWVEELSLGANHDIKTISRLSWKTLDGTQTPTHIGSAATREKLSPPYHVTLNPMEIRTFHLHRRANS